MSASLLLLRDAVMLECTDVIIDLGLPYLTPEDEAGYVLCDLGPGFL